MRREICIINNILYIYMLCNHTYEMYIYDTCYTHCVHNVLLSPYMIRHAKDWNLTEKSDSGTETLK